MQMNYRQPLRVNRNSAQFVKPLFYTVLHSLEKDLDVASDWAYRLEVFADFSLKTVPQIVLHWVFLTELDGAFAWLCCIATLLVFAKGSLLLAAAVGAVLGTLALFQGLPIPHIQLVCMAIFFMLLIRKGFTALVMVGEDLEDERKPNKRRQ